jgi:coenzyme F420-reducing hydrogenase beta subunit
MLPDKEQGFLYPVIDKNLCTDCGKCIKHCPANHPIKPVEYQQKVYAGWIKKRKNRKFSTSGGLFVALAEYVLKEKGVVFGVEWDKSNYGAKHSYCEKIEEIYKYQGSKYIQSNIGNSYKDVKSFLDEGRLVLFSGTPCQVAGLKYYLNKDYDYLFTIDLVCHGVPSSKVLWKEIEEVERRHGVKLVNLRFRHKTPDQLYASMRYEFNDGTVLMQSIFRSFFSEDL